jgi:hypothetical protein
MRVSCFLPLSMMSRRGVGLLAKVFAAQDALGLILGCVQQVLAGFAIFNDFFDTL